MKESLLALFSFSTLVHMTSQQQITQWLTAISLIYNRWSESSRVSKLFSCEATYSHEPFKGLWGRAEY